MTIRKKLVFSNILMIVIPVIAGILLSGFLLEGTGNKYGETMENMLNDKNGLYSAQSIIFSYKEEFLKQGWQKQDSQEEDVKVADNYFSETKKMRELAKELTALGYHLSIRINERTFFDNISQAEHQLMSEFVKDTQDKSDSLAMTSNETAIVINSFHVDNYEFEISALHTPDNKAMEGNQSYLRKYILKSAVVLILGILVVIVLLNTFLSWWISRSILIPLKKLSIGSRKIKDGELGFQLDYNKQDEFGVLCKDFDEMRGYLKESVEDRLRYERYRTELLSGISHDLRTPLTSIKGYVEGLIDGIADTPEKQKRYYDAIHTRANDMEGLVDNLSTYTHLENGQDHYDFKTFGTDGIIYLK